MKHYYNVREARFRELERVAAESADEAQKIKNTMEMVKKNMKRVNKEVMPLLKKALQYATQKSEVLPNNVGFDLLTVTLAQNIISVAPQEGESTKSVSIPLDNLLSALKLDPKSLDDFKYTFRKGDINALMSSLQQK